jgi:hypothetical protein
MMLIEIKAHVNENGLLEVQLPDEFASRDVRIFVEQYDPDAVAESEARWDELFAKSQDVLSRMAEEVREERRKGLIEDLTEDDFA